MKLDVSLAAGFDLRLDTETLQLETGTGMRFTRATRTVSRLKNVLRSPDLRSPDRELYHVFNLAYAPEPIRATLNAYHLTFSPVLMLPGTVEREFIKTTGHYHPAIPGSSYSYPELYTQFHGKLLLLLQKRNRLNPETPLDCVLILMTPGVTVAIPPDYAHVLINPSKNLALMAGLYNITFGPDYAEVEGHQGLAYYLLDSNGNGNFVVEANPRYMNAPPLQRLVDHAGTPFAPPDPGVPLWQSFMANPGKYSFLSEPEATENYFPITRCR